MQLMGSMAFSPRFAILYSHQLLARDPGGPIYQSTIHYLKPTSFSILTVRLDTYLTFVEFSIVPPLHTWRYVMERIVQVKRVPPFIELFCCMLSIV
jgi:hypothetical protein